MKAGCLTSGYTAHMLKLLERPRVVHLNARTTKVIGGHGYVTQNILASAVQRMQAWCALALHVVRGEFPGFEALQSFTVFKLSDSVRSARGDADEAQAHFQRIAQLLDLDCDQLMAQYKDYMPKALRMYNTRDMDTLCAWREALGGALSGARRKRLRQAHPCNLLVKTLARFAAYGGTTAGVERMFASKLSSDLTDDYANDVYVLSMDRDKRHDEKATDGAM